MPNNTPRAELQVVMQTMLKPNYTNSNVDNYYNSATMAPVVPTTGTVDILMRILVEAMLYSRSQYVYGYDVIMSDAELLDLYKDLNTKLADYIAAITAVKAPIAAKVAALEA